VGAGLGMSWLKARLVENNTKVLNKHVTNLAWQVMAGVVYQINNRWAIDAGYRYADLGRVRKTFGDGDVAKFAAREHDFMLGVRLSF
ncbi:MAG: outer membrane beta-barrel protein, partial [Alphaproteobacteria bacterium]|nr:outer membrane beta-barrel protein [Alphaproteobacteria bacterium]